MKDHILYHVLLSLVKLGRASGHNYVERMMQTDLAVYITSIHSSGESQN